MISKEEALDLILREARELGSERLGILSSINRVLSEDIYARDNIPNFDKAAMDGYAITEGDAVTGGSGQPLEVVGFIPAGTPKDILFGRGEAIRIMTGAAVPGSASAVIEFERVRLRGNSSPKGSESIILGSTIPFGNNIIKAGEELTIGQVALPRGTIIDAPEVGLLATLGYSEIMVYRAPRVSLIITGEELLDISEELTLGKIRNCNEYSLKALLKPLGVEIEGSGIIRDDFDVLKACILKAFDCSDIVISSGGASFGDFDFVERALVELGADIKFSSIAMKPGKPMGFAIYRDKLFFSLPGNPLSLITTFEEFVRPAIQRIKGIECPFYREFSVKLGEKFTLKPGRTKHVYVKLEEHEGIIYAYNIGNQSSNQLRTLCDANGMIIVTADRGELEKGDIVRGRFIFGK